MNKEKNVGKMVKVRVSEVEDQAWRIVSGERGQSVSEMIRGLMNGECGLGVGGLVEKVSPAKQVGGKKPREKVGRGVASAPVKMLNGYRQEEVVTGSAGEKIELKVPEPVLADWCISCLGRHGDLPVREGEPMELNGVKGWLCRWCLAGREPGQEKSIEDVVQESMGQVVMGCDPSNWKKPAIVHAEVRDGKTYVLDRERKFERDVTVKPDGGVRVMDQGYKAELERQESASGLLPPEQALSREQKQVVFDQLKAQFGQAKLTDISDYPEKITPAHFETTAENPHNLPAIAEVVEQCPF